MDFNQIKAYDVLEKRTISDLNSEGYILRHKKTNARVVLLENDDDNKVFYIGFRTPPADSTGVAHILEHSVLCGSKHFPVKDPFVELAKGSLNTFLNAMTYPDKTVYPVASCNDKDFHNLMHVYLDAVFYPNIYKEPNIFMQEGWHYHLEEENDELAYNGVVYNEMKGAFSSPDDVLDRTVLNSLFPENSYDNESGGDPEAIPDLTYEQFLEFHGQYYHPSNSYIYLYGNMDMAEKLNWIDETYLDKFDYLEIDSTVKPQPKFEKPIEVKKEYSVTDGEENEDGTYLSCNMVIGTNLDRKLYIAFSVLDYALCSAAGAPLKQALIEKGIGKDVYSFYENGIYQPYFSIIAKGAREEQKKEFLDIIERVLTEQMQQGINKKALMAGLNYYEFKYKEADYGTYPKGLMYGLQALDSWLYDDDTPFYHIEANETFASLKEEVEGDYFEQLIRAYLLENTHKAIVTVVPIQGLTSKRENELQQKLAAYKESLSKEEIKDLVQKTNALLEYQDRENKPEDIETLPMLKREDLKKETEKLIYEPLHEQETDILFHEIFTNGISYSKLVFDATSVEEELLPYLGLLKNVLGLMDTEHFSYGDLFNEMNLVTGGISPGINMYVNSKNTDEFKLTFEIKAKSLYENTEKTYQLLYEILYTTKLEDTKRLLEIISECKARMQASMMSAGHSVAALRAMSGFSVNAAVTEKISGIPFYRLLCELEKDFENKNELVVANMKKVCQIVFRPENLLFDYTGTKEGLKIAIEELEVIKKGLCKDEVALKKLEVTPVKRKEAFKTSGQVQYVCSAGDYKKAGLSYTGALRALKVIMGYEYLWMNIRVKGGAYGCMSHYGRNGESYLVSYRDPNLKKTMQVYEDAAEFIRQFRAEERDITKYIIGALSDLDMPKNPAARGASALAAYLCNVTEEDEQKQRDELLNVNESVIRDLAQYLEAIMSEDCFCVVGSEDMIQKHSDLFEVIENLL